MNYLRICELRAVDIQSDLIVLPPPLLAFKSPRRRMFPHVFLFISYLQVIEQVDASKNRWSFGPIADSVSPGGRGGLAMSGQRGFFDVDERLKQLSAKGDSLERLNAVVDFELFRADLERAGPRSERSKGGRPAFAHVLMSRACPGAKAGALVLQASHDPDRSRQYVLEASREHVPPLFLDRLSPLDHPGVRGQEDGAFG